LAVNERPPSGYSPDYDAYGYDGYSSGSYQTVGTTFSAADPLFGPSPEATGTYAYVPQGQGQTPDHGYAGGYDAAYGAGYGTGYDTGYVPAYDTAAYGAGYDTGGAGYSTGYDPYAAGQPAGQETGTYPTATGTYYDTGTYDTSALWQQQPETATGYYPVTDYQDPYQAQATAYQTATMPTIPQQQSPQPQQQQQPDWDSGAYPAYGYGYGYDAGGDTGIYEQVAPPYQEQEREQPQPERDLAPEPRPEPVPAAGPDFGVGLDFDLDAAYDAAEAAPHDDEPAEQHDYAPDGPGADVMPAARSRRRKPHKRSALLTVGVPSVAVMGVAAVGAAAVSGVGVAQDTTSQADAPVSTATAAANAPTTQLDRQLTGVSADADDFATRASRTQERIDLKDREAAAKKAKQEAAARKEALRPKYLLPVKQKGLSAYFGQAGVNWMALHTGIDFPVQVGTPVTAVTDGTVRTQWNSSYGNMAIVTAPDGTETWYCHLSSTKVRSGSVKAGDVIAYSGNTGNTTGPHLHLEVRPGGGAPIDPLPWLLSHGLDPR
jgi:hypothetical protein